MRIKPTTLVKTGLCVAALWWVARGLDAADFVTVWTNANPWLLLAGLAIFMLTPLLQGVRLRRLLAAQGTALGMGESVRLAFAGNFMNFAVPVGSTTGDVYKAAYLGQRMEHSWEAVVTTFFDRAVGLATLLFTVAAIAVLSGPESPLATLRPHLVILCLGLIILVVAVRYSPLDGEAIRSRERVPARDILARAVDTLRGNVASPRVLTAAVIDTLGIQVAATASFLCAALALGFRLHLGDGLDLYAFFSAGEIVKALPGPPQGLGTLETAYGLFFGSWATASQIVSAAVAIRAINLICSLPGAPFAVATAPAFALRSTAPNEHPDRRLATATSLR